MCVAVLFFMIFPFALIKKRNKSENSTGFLESGTITEIFVVLLGFIAYDFVFFQFIVRKYTPLSGGGFVQRVFGPVMEHNICLPAPKNDRAENLLVNARAMQSAIDAGNEAAYRQALKDSIQSLGGTPPSPVSAPSTPSAKLDTSKCQKLAALASSAGNQMKYGIDPGEQALLEKLSACAQE